MHIVRLSPCSMQGFASLLVSPRKEYHPTVRWGCLLTLGLSHRGNTPPRDPTARTSPAQGSHKLIRARKDGITPPGPFNNTTGHFLGTLQSASSHCIVDSNGPVVSSYIQSSTRNQREWKCIALALPCWAIQSKSSHSWLFYTRLLEPATRGT